MRRALLSAIATFSMFMGIGLAWQSGPYKILKAAKVGGEGGWDYIYADVAGRAVYSARRDAEVAADTTPQCRRSRHG